METEFFLSKKLIDYNFFMFQMSELDNLDN